MLALRVLTVRHYSMKTNVKDVFIVSAARTPVGSYRGLLAPMSAPQLGAKAIRAVVDRAGIPPEDVQEVYLGCALQGGMGQAPARQASLFAGLPKSTPCTIVNKVCASGMKAIMFASQSLMCGHQKVVVAGGMESMSNTVYYLPRGDTPYGTLHLLDSIEQDGLIDVYSNLHMGQCAEITAREMSVSRQQQEEYGLLSYQRSAAAYEAGVYQGELLQLSVPLRKGKPDRVVTEDEEFRKINYDRYSHLPTIWVKEVDGGTIHAGTSSKLGDGAAATLLMAEEAVSRFALKPLARVVGFQDSATEPTAWPLAPAIGVKKLLERYGLNKDDIALWEINEAFSIVVLANMKLLDINPSQVNINGGAISLGHPFGMSGVRITNHLVHALKSGQKGIATLCNGGGGASSILIEKL